MLLLQIAVMMFGLSGVIGRTVGASSIVIAGGRVLFSSVILFIILKLRKVDMRAKSRQDALIACLGGILLAIHWPSFFQSVQAASVTIGTVTFSTFPLFLIFLEPLVFHQKISVRNIFLAIGLIVGVLITIPEFSFSNEYTMGVVWGMVSSLSYALLTLCNKNLSSKYEGMWISCREQSITALILIPIILLRGEQFTASDVGKIAAIGVFCTAIGFSLFVSAQKYVSAQTAGIAAGMETVYSIIFAVIFLREYPTIREIVGGVIIFIIATISALPEKKKAP